MTFMTHMTHLISKLTSYHISRLSAMILCAFLGSACSHSNPLIADGKGGRYKIGGVYKVKGIKYRAHENLNYVETGIASWYGKDFHGRRTANGEIFNMHQLTAAHKTLPMPTYARVTNLSNQRSLVLRINDRGPYKSDHGTDTSARIIDLSYQAAKMLGFAKKGTAFVEVRYVGRARPSSEGELTYNQKGYKPKGYKPTSYKLQASQSYDDKPYRLKISERRGEWKSQKKAKVKAGAKAKTKAKAGGKNSQNPRAYYVQIGAFSSRDKALRAQNAIKRSLLGETWIDIQRHPSKGDVWKVAIGMFDDKIDARAASAILHSYGYDPLNILASTQ